MSCLHIFFFVSIQNNDSKQDNSFEVNWNWPTNHSLTFVFPQVTKVLGRFGSRILCQLYSFTIAFYLNCLTCLAFLYHSIKMKWTKYYHLLFFFLREKCRKCGSFWFCGEEIVGIDWCNGIAGSLCRLQFNLFMI